MSAVFMWIKASWKLVLSALAIAQLMVMYNVQPVDGTPIGWRVD